jgi:magnesium-transporting ATPase (P-type)
VADLLRVAAMCGDARLVPGEGAEAWRVTGDRTEGAIVVAATKAGVDLARAATAAEWIGGFPFDPRRKLTSTLHRREGGAYEARVKGSPEAVPDRCGAAVWAGDLRPLDAPLQPEVVAAGDAMAATGLQVLAVVCRALSSPGVGQEEVEPDLRLLGLVAMSDPRRPEVTEAVAACWRAGIRIVMVTGDYGLTGEAIARRVGILDPGPARVVTGAELEAADDAALGLLLDGGQVVFAWVAPEHKLRIVEALKTQTCGDLGLAMVTATRMTVDRLHRRLRHVRLEPEPTFGNGEWLLVRAAIPTYLEGATWPSSTCRGRSRWSR